MTKRAFSHHVLLAGTALCVAHPVSAQTSGSVEGSTPTAQDTDMSAQDEIVVTGVLRDTTADKAAASITTISESRIEELVPLSAADLLSEIPGVVVDTDVGEVNNVVYTRGLSGGTSASTTGYFWTTILEDGAPTAAVFYSNYQPDQFLRADVTLKRVQAVRGGSAAVTGPNAPGGLFNYISKNGMTDRGGRFQVRLGLEGGDNLFQRYEVYYGARNDAKTLAYSFGGHLRRSYGYRDTPEPLNEGGQFKANFNANYNTGLGSGGFLLSLKYLNDQAGNLDQFRPLARGFDNPQFTEEFGRIVNFSPVSEIGHNTIYNGQLGFFYDPNNYSNFKQEGIGLKWDHDFGGGWEFSNNARFNDNTTRHSYLGGAAYNSLFETDTFTRLGTAFAGLSNTPGFFDLKDRATGQLIARVNRITAAAQNTVCVPGRTVTNGYCLNRNVPNLLPNQQIVNDGAAEEQNNLILGIGTNNGNALFRSREFTDLATMTKQFKRVTITVGAYISDIEFDVNSAFGGGAIMPLQNAPDTLDVTFTTGTSTTPGGPAGTVYQLTDPTGFAALGSTAGLVQDYDARVQEFSPLLGFTWEITDRLLVDLGARYTFYRASGRNRNFITNNRATQRSFGGVDGNPLTIFDNVYASYDYAAEERFDQDPANTPRPAGMIDFDKKLDYLQYTGAINWNINDSNGVYVRYTSGKKNTEGFWSGFNTTQGLADELSLKPQPTLNQFEASWQFRNSWMRNQAVFYYTKITGTAIRRNDGRLEDGVTRYTSRPFFSVSDYMGVEIDNRVEIFDWLDVRNVFTWNRSRALSQPVVSNGTCNGVPTEINCPGGISPPDDDFATYQSGPQERSPSIIYNGTVNLNFGPIGGFYRFRYIDDRPTTIRNTRFLPATRNSDAGLRWRISGDATLSLNVNNLFDSVNVTQIGQIEDLPTGVTEIDYEDLYPNALVNVRTNAPRSYFLTLNGRF